jgi:hypothetical protein
MVPFIGIGVLSAKGHAAASRKPADLLSRRLQERMEAKAYFKPLSGAGFTAKL